MRDELADLLLGDAVAERAFDVSLELIAPVHGGERGHRDEAAVALGEARALPHVAVDHLLAQVDELGDGTANLVACGRCRCGCGHGVPPKGESVGGLLQEILTMPGCMVGKRSATCGS